MTTTHEGSQSSHDDDPSLNWLMLEGAQDAVRPGGQHPIGEPAANPTPAAESPTAPVPHITPETASPFASNRTAPESGLAPQPPVEANGSGLGFRPPERETERHFSKRTKIVAAVAAVAALAGIGFGIKEGTSSSKPRHSVAQNGNAQKPGDVQVQTSAGPGATIIPEQPNSPSAPTSESVTPNPNAGLFPDTVTQQAELPGNITNALYPGLGSVDIEWHGSQTRIPELTPPGTVVTGYEFTEQDTGRIVVRQLAALMSLPSTSPDFTKVLDAFTDNVRVKAYVLQKNQQLRAEAPDPSSDQVILFDNASSPITFGENGFIDPSGNPLFGLTGGTLYARYLNKDCWFSADGMCTLSPGDTSGEAAVFGDPRAYTQADANVVNSGFRYSYSLKSNPDGTSTMKINDISFETIQPGQ